MCIDSSSPLSRCRCDEGVGLRRHANNAVVVSEWNERSKANAARTAGRWQRSGRRLVLASAVFAGLGATVGAAPSSAIDFGDFTGVDIGDANDGSGAGNGNDANGQSVYDFIDDLQNELDGMAIAGLTPDAYSNTTVHEDNDLSVTTTYPLMSMTLNTEVTFSDDTDDYRIDTVFTSPAMAEAAVQAHKFDSETGELQTTFATVPYAGYSDQTSSLATRGLTPDAYSNTTVDENNDVSTTINLPWDGTTESTVSFDDDTGDYHIDETYRSTSERTSSERAHDFDSQTSVLTSTFTETERVKMWGTYESESPTWNRASDESVTVTEGSTVSRPSGGGGGGNEEVDGDQDDNDDYSGGQQSDVLSDIGAGLCADPDGDGWGWNGSTSCEMPGASSGRTEVVPQKGSCEDSDGDGWGWDGSASCLMSD